MEEQFILRVPPSIAQRINRVLSEIPSSPDDNLIDLSFSEDGREGTFVIGNESFPTTLLDLPGIVESYKSYDDTALIKTADIGQIIMVKEEGQPPPPAPEFKDGLTPPMRDARRRRFRRRPDINPEVVSRVEEDLIRIMAGGTAHNVEVEVVEEEEEEEDHDDDTMDAPAEEEIAASSQPLPNEGPSNIKHHSNEDVEMKEQDSLDTDDEDEGGF